MRHFLKIIGIYLAFIAQSLIFENIKILSCSPDVLIVAIIMCSVSLNTVPAALIGGFAGLLSDALFGKIFGLNILLYMYLAIFVSMAVSEKTENSPLLMSWVTFASVTVMEVVLMLFKTMFGYSVSMGFLGTNILIKGVFGAVFTLLFVWLQQKIIKHRAEKKTITEEETV